MSDATLKDSVPWWVKVLRELGLPTAILVVMTYGIWQAATWFGNDIAMPMYQRQMKFIDEVQHSVKEMADASTAASAGQTEMAREMKANGETLKEIKDAIIDRERGGGG